MSSSDDEAVAQEGDAGAGRSSWRSSRAGRSSSDRGLSRGGLWAYDLHWPSAPPSSSTLRKLLAGSSHSDFSPLIRPRCCIASSGQWGFFLYYYLDCRCLDVFLSVALGKICIVLPSAWTLKFSEMRIWTLKFSKMCTWTLNFEICTVSKFSKIRTELELWNLVLTEDQ